MGIERFTEPPKEKTHCVATVGLNQLNLKLSEDSCSSEVVDHANREHLQVRLGESVAISGAVLAGGT